MSESIQDQIVRIVNRLEKIAEVNDDAFKYRIIIDPSDRRRAFHFEAIEKADGHTFVDFAHHTLKGALDAINEEHFESACKMWGYKMPLPPAPTPAVREPAGNPEGSSSAP